MATTKLFLTGASGYIGGSVLHALLKSPNASKYSITALVRADGHVQTVEKLGVRVVQGSLDDLDLLEKESAATDIVVHTASAQLLDPAERIAAGMAKRHAEGKPAFLIHTSGTGIVSDRANGQFLGKQIIRDTDDIYTLEKSDISFSMRAVDTALIEAGEEAGFGVSIVAPPTIYGTGTGPIKRTTQQVLGLTLVAVHLRQTHYVGAGLSAWTHVHIEDLSSLYVLLIEASREGRAPSGREGYFFAETGEHTWKALSEAIAPILHAKGLVDSPGALPFQSDQQAADILTAGSVDHVRIGLASNSRVRAVRGREVLGWKPQHSDEDFFESMGEQVNFILESAKTSSA